MTRFSLTLDRELWEGGWAMCNSWHLRSEEKEPKVWCWVKVMWKKRPFHTQQILKVLCLIFPNLQSCICAYMCKQPPPRGLQASILCNSGDFCLHPPPRSSASWCLRWSPRSSQTWPFELSGSPVHLLLEVGGVHKTQLTFDPLHPHARPVVVHLFLV